MTKKKIMVVDDDADIIEVMSTKLKASGYDVVTANDTISATLIAMRTKPDVFILDICMPGGSGHMIADRLTRNSKTTGTPFVFLTGRTTPEDEAMAKKAGAFAYLTKPVEWKELLDTVANALEPATPCAS
jgi:CheY-like chemotaxis protein